MKDNIKNKVWDKVFYRIYTSVKGPVRIKVFFHVDVQVNQLCSQVVDQLRWKVLNY